MNTTSTSTDTRRPRRAFLIVGLIAPIVLAAVALAFVLAWLPELSDRIATHWSATGPDGFSSPQMYIWLQIGLGLALPALLALPVVMTMRRTWGPAARFLGAVSLGVAGLIAVMNVGAVAIQRGVSDGAEADGIGAVVGLGFGVLAVLGVTGWFLQPNVTVSAESARDRAKRLALRPGEKAAWFGSAAMGRPGRIGLSLAVLILIATTVWVFVMDAGAGWILAVVTTLVIVLIVTTLVFRVRINDDGLRVRSVAGWPRWNIPASEVTGVRVVDVNPMGDFGGWGLRIAVDGRMGVVLRTGEALQVTRKAGRVFIVTIDDATIAAAVLTAAMNNTDSTSDQGESA